ncbi:MAG TPA: tetratricopeptide repeat protein [Planctomycetota bacterium]|nr:tetratricopeptide repeat protein [Planctomycetota bacterium]
MNEPPPGRNATALDRGLCWLLVFVLAIAALVYAPAVPYASSLQEHAAILAGAFAIAIAAIAALAGRGFPLPPLPAGTVGVVAAMAVTAALPLAVSSVYSPARAWIASGSAAGLVAIAAMARSVSRAHLGIVLLSGAAAVGATVAGIGLAESLGLDPLGAAPFYDAKRDPVSTLGNPDPLVEVLAPVASVALAIACSRGGAERVLALAAAALAAALVGRVGVIFGQMSLAAGVAAASLLTFGRIGSAHGDRRETAKSISFGVGVLVAAFAAGLALRPAPVDGDAPASQPAIEGTWGLPPTLEVRARIAISAAKAGLAFAPLGSGAGNFAIAFARERDPVEIEISTHGRADPAESVVRVAHDDALQLLVETGALGAVALGALAFGAFRWLRRGLLTATPNTVAASAGLAALAVAAFGRSPFYDNASAACLGAMLLGVIGAADARPPERLSGGAGRALGGAALLAIVPAAVVAGCSLVADMLVAFERVRPLAGAERLVRASELAPRDERVPLLLAHRRAAEGDREGAKRAYDEALARNPFLVGALLNRGILLAEARDFAGAQSDFARVDLLDPRHPLLARNRAALERARGNDDEAARRLAAAGDRGGAAEALRATGMELFEGGELARALPYLDRWVDAHPDDADAWYRLGQIYLAKGERASAELCSARAHRLYALDHLRLGSLAAADRSVTLYRKNAASGDGGPFALEAAIDLARGDETGAQNAIERAEREGAKVEASLLERPELAHLRAHPDLGPRLSAITSRASVAAPTR